MAKLLNRVTKARELATAQFLKDLAIHEIAVLVKEVYPEVVSHMLAHRKKGLSDDSQTMIILNDLLSHHTQRKVTEERRKPGSVTNNLSDHDRSIVDIVMKMTESKHMADRYDRVVDHVRQLYQMLETCPLDGSACSVDERRRAIRGLDQFKSMLPKALDRAENMYSRSQMHYEPKIATFQGGGAKGMGYAGVYEMMVKSGIFKNIKYLAGTSAGALIALPMALGFDTKEVDDLVRNGRFAHFFAESTTFFKALSTPSLMWSRFRGKVKPEERPYLEGFNLNEFAGEFMVPLLSERLGIKSKDLLDMTDEALERVLKIQEPVVSAAFEDAKAAFKEKLARSNRRAESDLLQFHAMPGRTMGLQAAVTSVRARRSDKHPQHDLIESYLADLIEISVTRYVEANPKSPMAQKLDTAEKRRNLDFEELRQLAEETNFSHFKELGVAITESHMWSVSWFPRALKNTMSLVRKAVGKESKDDGFGTLDVRTSFQPHFARSGGGEYINMPIKTAVRASMNLPMVFKTMRYENKKYIDGGLNNNYAHRMFLDKLGTDVEAAERQSIGFMFSTVETDMEMMAIDEMARIAKRDIEIELDKYPDTWKHKLKDMGYEAMDFFKLLGFNLKELKFGKAAGQVASVFTAPLKKAGGAMVNWVMDRNNKALPSETILDNTGILNSGSVKTEDFHLSSIDKSILINAGKKSTLSLISDQSDRHLRFSKDRLISLINIENQLLKKEKAEYRVTLPHSAMNDPYRLAKALKEVYSNNLELTDVLTGKLPDIVRTKFTDNLPDDILSEDPKFKDYSPESMIG